jgi:hypothetical protein
MEPGAEGGLQSQLLGDPVSPFLASVGTTPNEAAADRLDFRLGLRLIDMLLPASRPRQWPIGQELALGRSKTPPWPVFRAFDKPGSQRVPLDVSQHRVRSARLMRSERI